MFEMKRITRAGVATALQKAERYRLLNEPSAAESICLDVLAIEPDNQAALVQLALARTDQFGADLAGAVERAREPLGRVDDPYKRPTITGSCASGEPRHTCVPTRRVAAPSPTTGCAAPWSTTRRRRRSARKVTTSHCSAGTPVPG